MQVSSKKHENWTLNKALERKDVINGYFYKRIIYKKLSAYYKRKQSRRRNAPVILREIYSRIMGMEPDIENMTLNEYLEYEAAKERKLIGAENMKRMGQDIVQDSTWEQDDDLEEDQVNDGDNRYTFDMWDITVEDVE
ncbi:hypothetical protein Tco_1056755 [Tanacetum coccineum]|uniref:Uncharacterized protein n=1 Tax=Tanacetum coccineum TaxID=301880 RepID=A0ABQ5H3E8_9ASTR